MSTFPSASGAGESGPSWPRTCAPASRASLPSTRRGSASPPRSAASCSRLCRSSGRSSRRCYASATRSAASHTEDVMRSEPEGGAGGSTEQEPPPELSGLTGLRARLDPGIPRNLELGTLFELFLVTAVVSLLLIRGLLALSGFPQVGGGGLHIAHMLWGGLLMLASLLLLLLFIDRRLLFWAAFLSGVGFGTFIDELRKFVTSDNDYFFRPAIAIVYVIFVLLFLVFRALEHRRRHSERELLANAFDIVREAVLHGRRPGRSAPVLAYLREHSGDDPLLVAFREILERTPPGPPPLPAPLRRLRSLAVRLYVALVDARGLDRLLAVIVA